MALRRPRPGRSIGPGSFSLGAILKCLQSRRWNPTCSSRHLGVKEGFILQEGKSGNPVSAGGSQEFKASQTRWSWQISSGSNPQTFLILGGRIPLFSTSALLVSTERKTWCSTAPGEDERQPLGVQGQPDLSDLNALVWVQSSDIRSFRRRNPTFGHRGGKRRPFPTGGKAWPSLCHALPGLVCVSQDSPCLAS